MRIEQSMGRILRSSLYKDVRVGILITEISKGEGLYSRAGSDPYRVASVSKLIPASACLMLLGPDYKFKTPILTDGVIKNGSVKGNLYLIGKGDPCLMTEDLEKAAEVLIKKGIRQVQGDLIYDISFLDKERNRYGQNARNLYAPPCAVTMNYNWIDVKMEKEEPPVLSLIPRTSYARLKYEVTFSDSALPGRPEMTLQSFPWGDTFFIKGVISAWDKQYHYVWLGVSRPGLYAATLFKEICSYKGLMITGGIREGLAPSQAKELAVLSSCPIKETVRIMNQESNNVIAETLCKDLGALFDSTPGTRSKGVRILSRFCTDKFKMKQGEFSIKDASGLDPENVFTPFQIISVLNTLYRNKELRDAFINSLAQQGHHPYALHPVPPEGVSCYVKSGTLSVQGVNTVAGYILLQEPSLALSFVILANREKPGPMTYSGTLTNPLLEALFQDLNP